MKKSSVAALVVIIAVIAGAGGYASGLQVGMNDSQAKAQSDLSAARSDADQAAQGAQQAWESYGDLSADYEELSTNYNNLYSAAKAYVAAPRYTPRQPVTCNSYSYGMNSVSTTCY